MEKNSNVKGPYILFRIQKGVFYSFDSRWCHSKENSDWADESFNLLNAMESVMYYIYMDWEVYE